MRLEIDGARTSKVCGTGTSEHGWALKQSTSEIRQSSMQQRLAHKVRPTLCEKVLGKAFFEAYYSFSDSNRRRRSGWVSYTSNNF